MKEVARLLYLTPRTVAAHKYTVMELLQLKTSAELVQYGMNGIEVAKELKKLGNGAKIVFLTVHEEPDILVWKGVQRIESSTGEDPRIDSKANGYSHFAFIKAFDDKVGNPNVTLFEKSHVFLTLENCQVD